MVHSMWEQWHHIGIIEGKKTSWISQKQVHIGIYLGKEIHVHVLHISSPLPRRTYQPTKRFLAAHISHPPLSQPCLALKKPLTSPR